MKFQALFSYNMIDSTISAAAVDASTSFGLILYVPVNSFFSHVGTDLLGFLTSTKQYAED